MVTTSGSSTTSSSFSSPPASNTGFSTGGFFMILTFPILPGRLERLLSVLSTVSQSHVLDSSSLSSPDSVSSSLSSSK
eukprot:Skav209480  [mRNA]  locus=scaffold1892:101337:103594:- [translate_table: standard]